eukprot:gene5990-8886_t
MKDFVDAVNAELPTYISIKVKAMKPPLVAVSSTIEKAPAKVLPFSHPRRRWLMQQLPARLGDSQSRYVDSVEDAEQGRYVHRFQSTAPRRCITLGLYGQHASTPIPPKGQALNIVAPGMFELVEEASTLFYHCLHPECRSAALKRLTTIPSHVMALDQLPVATKRDERNAHERRGVLAFDAAAAQRIFQRVVSSFTSKQGKEAPGNEGSAFCGAASQYEQNQAQDGAEEMEEEEESESDSDEGAVDGNGGRRLPGEAGGDEEAQFGRGLKHRMRAALLQVAAGYVNRFFFFSTKPKLQYVEVTYRTEDCDSVYEYVMRSESDVVDLFASLNIDRYLDDELTTTRKRGDVSFSTKHRGHGDRTFFHAWRRELWGRAQNTVGRIAFLPQVPGIRVIDPQNPSSYCINTFTGWRASVDPLLHVEMAAFLPLLQVFAYG